MDRRQIVFQYPDCYPPLMVWIFGVHYLFLLLLKEDGWDTDPFVLTEKDGKLYGRGSSDDKGPVIGWIHAVEAFQKTKQDVPVNIKVRFIYRDIFLFIDIHMM